MKDLGAEVVKADFDDVNSLKRAFQGAYGVYGVTGMSLVYSVMLLVAD